MSSVRRPEAMVLVVVLVCGVARGHVARRAVGSAEAVPDLPATAAGVAGRHVVLGPSEKLLSRSPGVRLIRRAYGPTQVALVSTSGIREIHPPVVCLRAMGLEVVQRGEERAPGGGCVVHLRVRGPGGQPGHVLHSYLDPSGEAGCRFWSRAGSAMAARLVGQSRRWSTLQVADRDATRARRVFAAVRSQIAPAASPGSADRVPHAARFLSRALGPLSREAPRPRAAFNHHGRPQ